MFDHILVPLDGSLLAECVLPHVAAFAQTSLARVTLLHVMDNEAISGAKKAVDPFEWAIRKVEAEVYQQGVRERLKKAGLEAATAIIEGRAADSIINYANETQADLIVLSSHGRSGLSGFNISSVVQKVLQRTHKSLLIIPAYRLMQPDLTGFRYRNIFVGLDGSRRAEWVLPEAMQLIAFHQAALMIAHVVPRLEMPCDLPIYEEEHELINRINERSREWAELYLKDLCSRLSEETDSIKTNLVISENQIDALRELAEQESADLVILSAHGSSGGFKRLYGSVTLSFITYGSIPMLILQDLHPGIIKPTAVEIVTMEQPNH